MRPSPQNSVVFHRLLLILALAGLLLVSACRQTGGTQADSPGPEAAATAETIAPTALPPAATDPPPAPQPTAVPLPTPWPETDYDPDLPAWTILVYTTAGQLANWQTAAVTEAITSSIQLRVTAAGNLASLLRDGRESAPANRYALILNQGSEPPELPEAAPPVDLILFDQSHTAQLELLNAWQPYGRLAVASPAYADGWLSPGQIERLAADLPEGDATDWANWLLDDYAANHTTPELLDWQPLTAFDLQQLPQVSQLLPALDTAPRPVLFPISPPVTMRMQGVEQYDLGQWADAANAVELATAVNQAIIYSSASRFGWQLAFSPTTLTAPPLLQAHTVHNLPLNSQQPAYLLLELAGVGLTELTVQIGRHEEDGRVRLVHLEPVPTIGGQWADGIHQFPWLWQPLTPFLSDGESAGHLPLWPLVDGRLAAAGQYTPVTGTAQDGWLVLTPDAADLAPEIWLLPANPADWRVVRPEPGDGFAVYNLYLTTDGNLAAETGGLLDLRSAGGLQLSHLPLPAGEYSYQFIARNLAGETAVTQLNWLAAEAPRWPNHRMNLDLASGFQFAYPHQWPPLEETGGRWQGHDPQQVTQFTITRLTDWPGSTAADLSENALAMFGQVERLLEEPTTVDGQPGQLTAYGYQGPDGPRTGLLLTFVRDGLGYLVDIDGPLAAESENLSLARTVAASWVFWTPLAALTGEWQRLDTDRFSAYRPAGYRHQPLDNGWHLLREAQSTHFIALRQDNASGRTVTETAHHWLAIAGRDVDNFAAKEAAQLALAGHNWTRLDFSYTQSGDRPVYGLILTTLVDGREWSVWAEAPAANFETLTGSLLLYVVASINSN